MSGYPGAGRPHGGHQSVGGMPQPVYGGGYQQGPPPQQYQQGYNPGYGAPPPQMYQGQQSFPQPYSAPPAHDNYQNYQGGGQPSYGNGGGQGGRTSNPYPQPMMHYAAPGQGPPMGQVGPSQYQGGQFQVHSQPVSNAHLYSNCSGKRKALLIGINYTGTSAALRGCHNDVANVSRFLTERFQYRKEDMVTLCDLPGASGPSLPTRANITRAMQWLVSGAQPNDSLFFHYSGHGSQQRDTDGDEEDGYDETICPLDYKQAGQISDDEMHHYMVKPLPQGCRLTAIFDSCHSGSALDLPYIYSTKGVLKEPSQMAAVGTGAMGAFTSYARGDMGGVFKSVTGLGKKLMNGDKAQKISRETRTSNADVISWSGSKDSQTSADATIGGTATGAMSHAFIASLTKYPQQTYMQLLNTIRDEISAYSQKPQLSCSHQLDVNLLAIM